jgi:hypothetical protein
MKNYYYLAIIFFTLSCFYACKKDTIKKENASLITGSWLVSQQNTRVYDLNTNALLKDTTITYNSANYGQAWYDIYNTDGTAYVTTTPYTKPGSSTLYTDTTSYLHYSILGSSLFIKPTSGGTETDPILQLTLNILTLERTYNGHPLANWGLDVNANYTFVVDTYYSR